MSDPEQLASLEGQQYLVLRPVGAVADFCESERASLLGRLPSAVTHPHTAHVTLRGFAEPERVGELRNALARWARAERVIELSIDAVDGFPPPFQILIARLERTSSLTAAYASLTAALDETDFVRIGELSLDDWIFHLSLVYCGTLSTERWESTASAASRGVRPRPSEVVADVEFVWYRDGIEHIEPLALGGSADQVAARKALM